MTTWDIYRRVCRLLSRPLLAATVLASLGAEGRAASGPGPKVELDCKIVSSSPEFRYKTWRVEMRRANGNPLWQAIKGTGESVHLKDLDPGIYVMCITGNQAGQHCESFDLNPPADRKFFRFKKRLQTPEPTINTPGAHRISVSDLSIPQAARLELARSEEAELHANPEQALRHLERALEIFPNFASALNNMGVHYYRIHDFAKSVQYLRKATEADPDSYAAWSNLGSSILSTGKFKEALEANQRANALRPDDARSNSQLALNHYYLHDYARAMDYFEKTLALDPQSATYPQLFLAQIAIIRKQQEEAERYIRDFLRLHPNSPQAARLKEVLDQVAVQNFVSLPAIDLTTGP